MRSYSDYDYEPHRIRAQQIHARKQFIMLWSIAVGLMDTAAGLLLVVTPEQVLKMLGMPPAGAGLSVLLSWIGILVGSIGVSYLIALTNRFMGKAVWLFTALPHALAAVMVVWQVENNWLPTSWMLVAPVAMLVAVVQVAVVRVGWWSSVIREQFADGTPSGYDNRMSMRS